MRILFVVCSFFASIAWAQPENPEINRVPAATSSGSAWRFAVGGSLGLGSMATFDEVTSSSSSGKIKVVLHLDPSLSLEADARYLNPNSWGFIGGLTFDAEKKVTKAEISGLTINTDESAKVQTTVIYGSAAYRWNQFYLPFGLNLSSVKFTPGSSFTGSYSESGGMGIQLGVGYYFSENFVMEGHSRVVAMKLKTTSGSTTLDYGNGLLSTLMITGKYIF